MTILFGVTDEHNILTLEVVNIHSDGMSGDVQIAETKLVNSSNEDDIAYHESKLKEIFFSGELVKPKINYRKDIFAFREQAEECVKTQIKNEIDATQRRLKYLRLRLAESKEVA